jgi:hypothetical protein
VEPSAYSLFRLTYQFAGESAICATQKKVSDFFFTFRSIFTTIEGSFCPEFMPDFSPFARGTLDWRR